MASVQRAGDTGWLIECSGSQVLPLVHHLRSHDVGDLLSDIIPASQTILVIARSIDNMSAIHQELLAAITTGHLAPRQDALSRRVVVPVRYGGPDLLTVARSKHLSPREVAEIHASSEFTVAFFGFAPGFAYLDGLSPRLTLPRRPSPRRQVEEGYIAIAANQTVIYPGGTPGGWHLIGRTETRLWDLNNDPPALLSVGDTVTFESIE